MQISNDKQDFRSDNPVWVLLAELLFSDFLSDHDRRDEPTVGLLFQTVQKLGMPLECMENIAMLVTEFTKESPVYYKQEGPEFPPRIRIFCQKKILDDANAARATSQPDHTEQAMEHSPMILDFGTKMNGGWGCFLIERGCNVSDDASLRSHHLVDLYLYREG
jgi:hypothetical protein